MALNGKIDRLLGILREAGSAVIALSGGVDSSFLLKAASVAGIRALAVTGQSETIPKADMDCAIEVARAIGVPHRIIRTHELDIEGFASNPPQRCFHCKDHLFGLLDDIAKAEGYACVIEGSNADDSRDHRPGMRAARERGVQSPLLEAGLSKSEIREASREMGLSTWDRPSSPCLSSRIPYGMRITPGALSMIARAEDAIRALGIRELRVRHHGDSARIEVGPEDMPIVLSNGPAIAQTLKEIGYKFVSMDIEGLKSGSMNRVIV